MILKGSEVESLLQGQERSLLHVVKLAYEAHRRGQSFLPQSTFLRFPGDEVSRIIALPAYLESEYGVAGIKWISSFPSNLEKGIERASGVLVLNCVNTGRPLVMMECSIVSAKRTAASAALAALTLHQDRTIQSVGIIGCGLINFEIVRFLLSIFPSIKTLYSYDLSPERADQFNRICQNSFESLRTEVVKDLPSLLRTSTLISIATTAIQPYINDLSGLPPGSTVLHVSLRDLAPEIIVSCDNVVDDIDHVCRAQTSVHLAEQQTGTRDFIRCTIADVTSGASPARREPDRITAFSPFGLGVLDLAVGEFVYRRALAEKTGTLIDSFQPAAWFQRAL
jgi:ornithine cyclodeaminase